jgi:hypothetical protein
MMSFLCGGKGRESGHNWQGAIVASPAMKSGMKTKTKAPEKSGAFSFQLKPTIRKTFIKQIVSFPF